MFKPELVKKLQGYSTPFYYYDLGILRNTLQELVKESGKYGFKVHYALKANSNKRLLELIQQAGLGADCVSGNEIKRAIECGFCPESIVFAGVGKSNDEINYGLQHRILCFNCESLQELEVINALALAAQTTACVALRINPNVNANTHQYITTGLEENKFGINMRDITEVIRRIASLNNLKLTGLHFHIGSQISDMGAFRSLCLKINEIQQWFVSRRIIPGYINVGGGLGINYHEPDREAIPDFKTYFGLFAEFLELQPGQQVHFELGRAITGQCGSLISRVLYVKKGIHTDFLILDAGMTELIRPALYQSYHKIENISKPDSRQGRKYDVVGPICESSDCFGKGVDMPESFRGDLIAIRSAGAYAEAMASGYNLRTQNPPVYSDELW